MGARANQHSRAWRRLLRAGALLGAAAALAGCAPSWPAADWSGSPHLSHGETLRFVADADCTIPSLFNPVKGDFFYEVASLQPVPGQRWLHRIEYQGATGRTGGVAYVLQRWTARGTVAAPLPEYHAGYPCVVIAEVPEAKNSRRPYYAPDVHKKGAEHKTALVIEYVVLSVICPVFLVLLVPARLGYEKRADWWLAGMAAVAVAGISLACAALWIHEPWRAAQDASAYWQWFDALPRASAALLPITTDEFYFLLRGPPNNTDFHAFLWATGTAAMAGAWIGFLRPAVKRGLYWIATPLPLEEAHDRAVAERRAPTVEELDAALFAAIEGKKAWQIDIMRRKAEAFVRRFARAGVWPRG